MFRKPIVATVGYFRSLTASPNGNGRVAVPLVLGILLVTGIMVLTGFRAASAEDGDPGGTFVVDPNLRLISSDDFDGARGTAPSPRMWNVRSGGGGWGNGEEQIFTNLPDNVSEDGVGNLQIRAIRRGNEITSGRIDTEGKMGVSSGLLAVRARLPEGQGINPAVWMLGSSIGVVGFPESGQINIFEQVNNRLDNSLGIIGPREDLADKTPWQRLQKVSEGDLGSAEDFHIYWVDRKAGRVTFGIDGRTIATFTPKDMPPQSVWVMDDPFFLVLDVAAGGRLTGPVGADALPARMLVDWVRMYG
ncbi:glycoside hydrolase family 16 protein [Gordonia sp. NPDC003429]